MSVDEYASPVINEKNKSNCAEHNSGGTVMGADRSTSVVNRDL